MTYETNPTRPSRSSDMAVARADGATLTPVSWAGTHTMSLAQWIYSGRRLGAIGRGVGWWIGDWLRFGNHRFGEKYAQASRITGYDSQTLMNMAYVASRVDPSRRREKLSWSHHAEIAAIEPEEQDQWLDLAEACRLSVHDMRLQLRNASKPGRGVEARTPSANVGETRAVCPVCGHSVESRRLLTE
jgi:hypothetical protein